MLVFLNFHVWAVNPTQGPLQQDPSLCGYGYNPSCNQSITTPRKKTIETIIVHKASRYGAVASDKNTGSIGDAINANSLAEAKKAAIRQCAKDGRSKNCKVITWVRNGCIAAAGGKLNGKWMLYNAAEKPNQAEKVAMNRCKAAGTSDCQIVIPEGCSVPDGMYD